MGKERFQRGFAFALEDVVPGRGQGYCVWLCHLVLSPRLWGRHGDLPSNLTINVEVYDQRLPPTLGCATRAGTGTCPYGLLHIIIEILLCASALSQAENVRGYALRVEFHVVLLARPEIARVGEEVVHLIGLLWIKAQFRQG